MSELNRTPNIPDDFSIGEAITSHNGVVCYPAMRKDSDEKFILKTIHLPASAVQLAALLLSGAYSSREAALEYYRELAKEIQREARVVNELSTMEGLCPFLFCQLEEKEDHSGFEVCLMAPYRHSLEQIFSEDVMTHQSILDLAMDICSALAACRRAGYLYIDLKPGNIFYDQSQGYKIGDLGIVSMSSLRFASLPDKYRSIYTAPEISDASSEISETTDVYALGLILYQAYNGGILPMKNEKVEDPLLPPLYADYEMAQIILTACHPDPAKRWKDPTAFGQALVQYMQTYGVAEGSIVPSPVSTPELDVGEEFLPEEDLSDPALWEDIPELEFMQELISDDTAPSEEDTAGISSEYLSEEANQILAQAEELMELVPPEPVVAPEPVYMPIPEPIVLEEEAPEEAIPEQSPAEEAAPPEESPAEPAPDIPPQNDAPVEPIIPAPAEQPASQQSREDDMVSRKRRKTAVRLISTVLIIALLVGLGVAGYDYYANTYLQEIQDISISGTVDSITVQILTDTDESLLQVSCSDTYGNTTTASVTNGTAVFTGLSPQTRYTIRVTISGFHKLTGITSDSFTTASQTTVDSFTAAIGPADCSVYLNITVSGVECDEWLLTYSAPNVEEQSLTFAGHNVTVYDLVAGAEYTFTLSGTGDGNVVGNTQITYQACLITKAANPVITACGFGSLTVQWEQPAGETVKLWTVRCYNSDGYDETVTTENLAYTFTGLTHDSPCIVEITADGMPQCVSITIEANPINITGIQFEPISWETMSFQWSFSGNSPQGGWKLNWSCDGTAPEMLETESNSVTLPFIPGGHYLISLIPADGSAIFGHSVSFTAPEPDKYSGHGITSENLQFTMCATPSTEKWDWNDLNQDAYRTDFLRGETAGFVVWSSADPELTEEETLITFVLRSADGKLVDISTVQRLWNTMWYQNICQIDIPVMPQVAGTYQIWIYFDGMLATTQEFIVQ